MYVADRYREHAMDHQSTEQLCADAGIKYEPLVFTSQGGVQRNAEAVIAQLAEVIARVEAKDAASIRAEMLQDVSLTLVRHAAQAINKRRPRRQVQHADACGRYLMEAAFASADVLE